MVDLTRDQEGRVRARLLDVVPGRSGTAYARWLAARPAGFTATVAHAALDPLRGYANAIRDELPDAAAVLDAFHVVKLAGQALDEVRRRGQQDTLGHRGHAGDPLFRIRNIARAGAHHLTDKQWDRLVDCLGRGDPDSEVLLAWQCYQQVRSAYATPDLSTGKKIAEKIVTTFASCPIGEIARLGKTLRQWKNTYLGNFTTDRSNNGGTEAICECGGGWSGTGWSGWFRSWRPRCVTHEAIGPLSRCPSVDLSAPSVAAGTIRPTSVT